LFGGYMGSSGGSTFDELLSWCRDKTLQSLDSGQRRIAA